MNENDTPATTNDDAPDAPRFTRPAGASYSTLRPADALAHLNERVAAELDSFERDCGLRAASIKLKRDKDTDDLLAVQVHAR